MMAKRFWKGESVRHNGREDRIRGNPEAPPMHGGPGASDEEEMTGADKPNLGTSQPRTKGNVKGDEFPLKHAHVKPHRHQMHQVLMAHALRMHFGNSKMGDDGTTQGTAIGGGAAGGGAGGGT